MMNQSLFNDDISSRELKIKEMASVNLFVFLAAAHSFLPAYQLIIYKLYPDI